MDMFFKLQEIGAEVTINMRVAVVYLNHFCGLLLTPGKLYIRAPLGADILRDTFHSF